MSSLRHCINRKKTLFCSGMWRFYELNHGFAEKQRKKSEQTAATSSCFISWTELIHRRFPQIIIITVPEFIKVSRWFYNGNWARTRQYDNRHAKCHSEILNFPRINGFTESVFRCKFVVFWAMRCVFCVHTHSSSKRKALSEMCLHKDWMWMECKHKSSRTLTSRLLGLL